MNQRIKTVVRRPVVNLINLNLIYQLLVIRTSRECNIEGGELNNIKIIVKLHIPWTEVRLLAQLEYCVYSECSIRQSPIKYIV